MINRQTYRMERIWMTRQLISPNWFWLSVFELPVRRSSFSRQTGYLLQSEVLLNFSYEYQTSPHWISCKFNVICTAGAHGDLFFSCFLSLKNEWSQILQLYLQHENTNTYRPRIFSHLQFNILEQVKINKRWKPSGRCDNKKFQWKSAFMEFSQSMESIDMKRLLKRQSLDPRKSNKWSRFAWQTIDI